MLALLNDFDKAERCQYCSVFMQSYTFTYGLMSVMCVLLMPSPDLFVKTAVLELQQVMNVCHSSYTNRTSDVV